MTATLMDKITGDYLKHAPVLRLWYLERLQRQLNKIAGHGSERMYDILLWDIYISDDTNFVDLLVKLDAEIDSLRARIR